MKREAGTGVALTYVESARTEGTQSPTLYVSPFDWPRQALSWKMRVLIVEPVSVVWYGVVR